MSFETTSILTTLHFELDGYFSLFFEYYKPNLDLKFFSDSFNLVFQHMSHLSTSGPCGMVFEHLQDCFHLEDLASGFLQLF